MMHIFTYRLHTYIGYIGRRRVRTGCMWQMAWMRVRYMTLLWWLLTMMVRPRHNPDALGLERKVCTDIGCSLTYLKQKGFMKITCKQIFTVFNLVWFIDIVDARNTNLGSDYYISKANIPTIDGFSGICMYVYVHILLCIRGPLCLLIFINQSLFLSSKY